MRVAALYDIHCNPFALQAVLEETRVLGVDQIVVGGDVLPGPIPVETMDLVLNLEIPTRFILGNCEIDVLSLWEGREPRVPAQFRPGFQWVADQLLDRHRRAIESWPKTATVNIPGCGNVIFCHATPRDDNEIFTVKTDEQKLKPVFDDVDADIIVCGHSHMQFDRQVGHHRVINAGSVGMPFSDPGAYWLLFDPMPLLRYTAYDLESAASHVRKSEHPEAEEFADKFILDPPRESEMVELYSKYELSA